MDRFWRIFFSGLLIIFSYHLIRDIFQIAGIHDLFVDFLHRPHQWCMQYCNYVTIPPELFIVASSLIVLRRDRIGKLGFVIMVSLIFWPLAVFLP